MGKCRSILFASLIILSMGAHILYWSFQHERIVENERKKVISELKQNLYPFYDKMGIKKPLDSSEDINQIIRPVIDIFDSFEKH